MQVLYPPTRLSPRRHDTPWVFLAGSIEQGAASLWQDEAVRALQDLPGTILNPRRPDWDASWAQDPTLGTPFYHQVRWELDGLDHADRILMHFDPSTKSPITLLELGLVAQSERLIVSCAPSFWRYGNVRVVCDLYDVECFPTLPEALQAVRSQLWKLV